MVFSDFYLFTDIDGTLGIENEGIPLRNITAISGFVENGGVFSLCTGRMAVNIKNFTKNIAINGTCIIHNGAALYDYSTGKSFGIQTLPKQINEYLRIVIDSEELLEVTAITQSGFFRVMNAENLHMPNDEDLNRRLAKLEEIHAPQLRVVFRLPPDCDVTEKVLIWNNWGIPGVDFIKISETCIEALPKGVSKGTALVRLCEIQGIPINRTFFIGDSYNDKEAFEVAGFSACVAETPVELQSLCGYVLGPCMDGALADFIHLLEMINLRIA